MIEQQEQRIAIVSEQESGIPGFLEFGAIVGVRDASSGLKPIAASSLRFSRILVAGGRGSWFFECCFGTSDRRNL